MGVTVNSTDGVALSEAEEDHVIARIEMMHEFLHGLHAITQDDVQIIAIGFVRWLACHLYKNEHRQEVLDVVRRNLSQCEDYWRSRGQEEHATAH